MPELSAIDRSVRWHVYDAALRSGIPPGSAAVAEAAQLAVEDVLASFRRLAVERIFVLQPDSGEILMAAPFSAVPTPFLVESDGLSAWGNCIWDALGIPAMLGRNARIVTSCGDCGAASTIEVRGGSVAGDGLVHFAIPAREWWKDIVFT
jgi:hypothetical protein